MANLAPQRAGLTGLAPTFSAASAGGDVIPPIGQGVFIVKNGGASSINVTIDVPGNTEFGIAQPDIVIAVAAGGECHIGNLTTRLTDPVAKGIKVAYSAVTSVTVAVIAV